MKIKIGSKVIEVRVYDKAQDSAAHKIVTNSQALRIIRRVKKNGVENTMSWKIECIKQIRELSRVVHTQGTTRIEYAMGLKETKDFFEALIAKHHLA